MNKFNFFLSFIVIALTGAVFYFGNGMMKELNALKERVSGLEGSGVQVSAVSPKPQESKVVVVDSGDKSDDSNIENFEEKDFKLSLNPLFLYCTVESEEFSVIQFDKKDGFKNWVLNAKEMGNFETLTYEPNLKGKYFLNGLKISVFAKANGVSKRKVFEVSGYTDKGVITDFYSGSAVFSVSVCPQ